MPLSSSVDTVLMSVTLIDDQGVPLTGSCTVTPSTGSLASQSGDQIIRLAAKTLQLDETGTTSVRLISSVEPDNRSTGVIWTLTIPATADFDTSQVLFSVPTGVATADISASVVGTANLPSLLYSNGVWSRI